MSLVLLLFVIFGGLSGLLKLLAISVAFPVTLISICSVIFAVNDLDGIDYEHAHTLLLSSHPFLST